MKISNSKLLNCKVDTFIEIAVKQLKLAYSIYLNPFWKIVFAVITLS